MNDLILAVSRIMIADFRTIHGGKIVSEKDIFRLSYEQDQNLDRPINKITEAGLLELVTSRFGKKTKNGK